LGALAGVGLILLILILILGLSVLLSGRRFFPGRLVLLARIGCGAFFLIQI
jgi:hypothetical protein